MKRKEAHTGGEQPGARSRLRDRPWARRAAGGLLALSLVTPGTTVLLGNTGDGGTGSGHPSVSGSPSSSGEGFFQIGQGPIYPKGEPSWCLSPRSEHDGTAPQAKVPIEVAPCPATDSPFVHWRVVREVVPNGQDKILIQNVGVPDLCLSASLATSKAETFPAELDSCNDPFSTLNVTDVQGGWEFSTPDGSRILTVPSNLQRGLARDNQVALFMNANTVRHDQNKENPRENPVFVPISLRASGPTLIAQFKADQALAPE